MTDPARAQKHPDLARILVAERAAISHGRTNAEPRIGLAFSGGGIRSATFNLGILQGMARRGLLKHMDYLSTVSGGGYIGAWYLALLKRQADSDPARAEALLAADANRQTALAAGEPVELPALTWLRRFSNYLTPKTGLSGDSLTMMSTYLRNLLLNLVVIVSFLGLLLLLPHMLTWAVPYLWTLNCLPWLATVPLMTVVLTLPLQIFSLGRRYALPPGAPWWQGQAGVLVLVVLPTIAAAYFLALGLASPGYSNWAAQARMHAVTLLPGLAGANLGDSLVVTQLIAMACYLLPWLAMGLAALHREQEMTPGTVPVLLLAALGASVAAGLMFFGLAHALSAATPFALATFGPPLVLLAFLLPVALHIGLARRRFSEMQREWWSRLGGWIVSLALAWLALFSIALYGPSLLRALNDWVAASGGLAWAAATVWGVLAGKGPGSGAPGAKGTRETLLGLVPWMFMLGLLGLLALGLLTMLEALSGTTPGSAGTTRLMQTAAGAGAVSPSAMLATGATLLTLFLLFGWRIDINLFSFHNFYRNRLTRCYLGASRHCPPDQKFDPKRCRSPNPFTGFDPDDDLAVSELGPRPYPLINTALNLVGGQELAWQQRKAASFCIAPCFSGYQFPAGMDDATRTHGFAPTRELCSADPKTPNGMLLGTAIAISGAAINPSMGFHSSPAVTFLLAVFNARLGRWVGNPLQPSAWRQSSPSFGVRYLFHELFGMTTARRGWFNLSDGGHFENLGLYELVRRRLPYIIASDATEDATYHFDDLANAIRKIRADFGIDIDIDVSGLRPPPDGGKSRAHAAIGVIRYDQVDPRARPGVLVYLRPGLTGEEPADVLSYARRNPAFPFQSTGDQFFDEAQFESYRQLGLHIADEVFMEAAVRHGTDANVFNAEAFFTLLKECWRGRLELPSATAHAHQARLDALFERLRTDPNLAFLSAEFFPEWPNLLGRPREAMDLPAYPEQRQAGFYLCREIAQFMELVYQDLDLENQADHPDCRGWMNLFRHWSWSPMFRASYAIFAATLGERFQRFCQRRLGLGLGDMSVTLADLAAGLSELNFIERDLAKELGGRTGATRLARFELVTRYPAMHADAAPKELLRFHFGFALLRGDALIFFRIQDHLRRMGLARQAMGLLLESVPALSLADEAVCRAPDGDAASESEFDAVRRVLHSVRTMRQRTP